MNTKWSMEFQKKLNLFLFDIFTKNVYLTIYTLLYVNENWNKTILFFIILIGHFSLKLVSAFTLSSSYEIDSTIG